MKSAVGCRAVAGGHAATPGVHGRSGVTATLGAHGRFGVTAAPQQVWGHSNSVGPTAGLSPPYRRGQPQHPAMPARSSTICPRAGPCPTAPPRWVLGEQLRLRSHQCSLRRGRRMAVGGAWLPVFPHSHALAGVLGRFATWLFWLK